MPKLIIVMGVSGCGKSSVASQLANDLAYQFVEADDYHSEQAKNMMAKGIPLTDEIRLPWLNRIIVHLRQQPLKNSVMAYSGLKREHRQLFRECGFNTIFVHLTGSIALISQRMQARTGHFMPESMLQSQFDSMQWPEGEVDVVDIDIQQSLADIIEQARVCTTLLNPNSG